MLTASLYVQAFAGSNRRSPLSKVICFLREIGPYSDRNDWAGLICAARAPW